MDFYAQLNQLIEDIEQQLDTDLKLTELLRKHHFNPGVLERVFPLLTNMSLSEYVRKRRLTLAGRDLTQSNLRVIDVAIKYSYDSAAAFSRAFEKFHGLKPGEVKTHASALKFCPKLALIKPEIAADVAYEVVELPALELYGIHIDTGPDRINHDAPQLFLDVAANHPELPRPDYGLTDCRGEINHEFEYRYWVLWKKTFPGLELCQLPASRWLKFHITSQEAEDIQSMSCWIWDNFLPTCCYELKSFPELESYHDNVTDYLIPIK